MDTFLKIWAIVGPILTAAVSALWARHVQTRDRDYQTDLAKIARQAAIEDRNSQHGAERERLFATEAKSAFSNFLSVVHIYVQDMATAIRDGDAANGIDTSELGRNLHVAYAAAAMVGNADTAKACYSLCSAAAGLPNSGEKKSGEFSDSATKSFVDARQELVSAVHNYLESLAEA